MRDAQTLVFETYQLDLRREQLWRGQEAMALTNKAFAVLRYLAQHADQLVTREALMEAVWPDVFVSDAALTVCIHELRQAFGETAQTPRCIETVRGRGYRFLPAVTTSISSAPAQPTAPIAEAVALVERETELALLRQQFARALDGERQLIFITGEPGIGKTTLVEAFAAQLGGASDLWIGYGQCVEHYGAGEAYLPLLEALGRLGRGPEGGNLIALLQQHAPSWLMQMASLAPAAEREALQQQHGGATRQRMLRELAEILEILTVERPLILVLEDLHWSDPSTLDWLAYAARRRDRARLLILGTYRPVDAIMRAHPLRPMAQELRRHGQCAELSLEYWSEAGVATYLRQRFGADPPGERWVRAIHQRTTGNPLFTIKVMDELVRQGHLQQEVSRGTLQGDPETVVRVTPDSLRQLIEHQLASLSSEEQALLETASVVGAVFSAAAVAAALQQEDSDVEARCGAMARRGQFIREQEIESWPDGTIAARFAFTHALYREVVYQRLTAGRRVRLHQRIGRRLEMAYGKRAREIAAALAMHFGYGRDPERALSYWRRAGDNMLQRCAHQEAMTHYERALDELHQLPTSPERDQMAIDLYFAIHRAGVPIGAYRQIMTALRKAEHLAERLGDQARLGQLCSRLSFVCRVTGDYETAASYARRGMAIGEALGESVMQAQSIYRLGQTYRTLGDYQQASECFRRIVRQRSDGAIEDNLYGFPSIFARAQLALCLAERGEFAEGLAHGLAGARSAMAIEHPFGRIVSCGGLGGLYLRQGLLTDAIDVLRQALALCRQWDMQDWFPTIAAFFGQAYALSGREAEALPLLEQAVEQGQALGNKTQQAFVATALGEVYMRAGQMAKAREQARQALLLAEAYQERGVQAWSLWLMGETLSQTPPRDTEAASASYQQALKLAETLEMRPLQAHCHHGLWRVYAQVGQPSRAKAAWSTAMAMYRATGMTYWLRQADTT